MKEIKFRAWNKFKKQMYPVTRLEFTYGPNGWTYLVTDIKTVMQYIGEKDKNNKEIWEGDIVRNPYEFSEDDPAKGIYEQLYEVKFVSGMFTLQELGDGDFVTSYPDWNNLEVIGNIYDNPELKEEIK